MSINEKIIEAVGFLNIPITADFSGNGEEEYITFNYDVDRAELHADNEAVEVVTNVQIHYFLPASKEYLENKKKIRKALQKAGANFPDVMIVMEPGNKTRHIIFECEFENDYEMEE